MSPLFRTFKKRRDTYVQRQLIQGEKPWGRCCHLPRFRVLHAWPAYPYHVPQQHNCPEYCQPCAHLTNHTHVWPGHLCWLSAAHCRTYASYGSPRCGGERLGHRWWGNSCDHTIRIMLSVYVQSFVWLYKQCQHNLGEGWADAQLIVQDLYSSTASARLTLEKVCQTLCLVLWSRM